MKHRDLGQQPMAPWLQQSLAAAIPKREPTEVIVVHHFTDRKDRVQLEVERRSATLGIAFERLFL